MSDERKYVDPRLVRSLGQYSWKDQLRRVIWSLGGFVFKAIPRPFHGIRCAVLRIFGAKIGKNCTVANSAVIFFPWNLVMGDDCAIGDWALIYNLGEVSIGNRACISHKAHVCAGTHDITRLDFPLIREQIMIGDEAWVCAEAFIGPGANVGRAAIVGARSVVLKDVEAEMIVGGHPAKPIRRRTKPEDV